MCQCLHKCLTWTEFQFVQQEQKKKIDSCWNSISFRMLWIGIIKHCSHHQSIKQTAYVFVFLVSKVPFDRNIACFLYSFLRSTTHILTDGPQPSESFGQLSWCVAVFVFFLMWFLMMVDSYFRISNTVFLVLLIMYWDSYIGFQYVFVLLFSSYWLSIAFRRVSYICLGDAGFRRSIEIGCMGKSLNWFQVCICICFAVGVVQILCGLIVLQMVLYLWLDLLLIQNDIAKCFNFWINQSEFLQCANG